MIEIEKMYHSKNGEILFKDAKKQWWCVESFNPEVGAAREWTPVVATKVDVPDESNLT